MGKKPATINENHARELLELHTVSPKAGYTQEDVIQLAYIMTGWSHKWSNKELETGDVWFDQDKHQKGEKQILGVKYKNDAKRELFKVIHDLATHPICIKFDPDSQTAIKNTKHTKMGSVGKSKRFWMCEACWRKLPWYHRSMEHRLACS